MLGETPRQSLFDEADYLVQDSVARFLIVCVIEIGATGPIEASQDVMPGPRPG